MKTLEEIFNQAYITANDLKIIMPTVGINACRKIIQDIAKEEREKGIFIPEGKISIAPTKTIRKKLGI